MDFVRRQRATTAAWGVAVEAGLSVERAAELFDSNKLTLWLQPADVVARIAVTGEVDALFELDLARRLRAVEAPVVALDPRIPTQPTYVDGFTISWWTHHRSTASSCSPAAYAEALGRLHAGMRVVETEAPHALDRVASAEQLVADRDRTPDLTEPDRSFLAETLTRLGTALRPADSGQLLHGEPHPGNLLITTAGPLFVDLETACRGPVEFDVAHAPASVAAHYPELDAERVERCRQLVLAMITTWRWDVDDRFPDGRQRGREWLTQLRAAVRGEASAEPQ